VEIFTLGKVFHSGYIRPSRNPILKIMAMPRRMLIKPAVNLIL
jgi:hypothetical protein